MKAVELLAPAKNLESGKQAINYGADAVYIGADRFGARAAAGNSLADIEALVKYAHQYRAQVFVTLNTILYNGELEEAQKLIYQIYHAGADALIVQDMGILKMDLPPIALHASTQTNNYSPERIKFFDEIGFERIVLARELSLKEIQAIRKQIKAELEFFVHGALCVSLSGQCYFSQAISGRSANRGMCAQMCRHPYNLVDAKGKKLAVNSHLLSLKDLNLSQHIEDLICAGVTSLKIEGRLKDANYVKNVVSYYRGKLDEVLSSDEALVRASTGSTAIKFEPDPERSFNRQSTTYFLQGRVEQQINPYSPKSMGKRLGVVDKLGKGFFTFKGEEAVYNGDGLCFIKANELLGLRAERVEGAKVFVNDLSALSRGMELYRNYDHEFNKQLEADKTIRKISTKIEVEEKASQLCFSLTDEDGLNTVYSLGEIPELAKNAAMAIKNIKTQLSKSGASIFDVEEVVYQCDKAYFFRASSLNEIRRNLFDRHIELRVTTYASKDMPFEMGDASYPEKAIDFSANVSNAKAEAFYKEHGVETQEEALEVSSAKRDQLLMTTRYCIKFEQGCCERFQGVKRDFVEPLYLEDQHRKYLLKFDCKNCLMQVRMSKDI